MHPVVHINTSHVFPQIETVEWESHNLEIMKALKGGTDALKAMHSEMSVDDVERLLEESNAAIEVPCPHGVFQLQYCRA